jgi:hypothetical protein
MQYIQRANLKPFKAAAFQQWLLDNASLLAEHAPEGWTYVGTWFTVRGFGQYDCEVRWELADYAALGSGFGTEAFQQAMLEAQEYIDSSRGGETYLMKSAADIRMQQGA